MKALVAERPARRERRRPPEHSAAERRWMTSGRSLEWTPIRYRDAERAEPRRMAAPYALDFGQISLFAPEEEAAQPDMPASEQAAVRTQEPESEPEATPRELLDAALDAPAD